MREDYFKWICSLVGGRSRSMPYKKLLRYLFDTDFMFVIDRDENRAIDGCDLRYRYGYYHDIPSDTISVYLDDRRCSVLEMMAALCNRIEENIMYDWDCGDRTGKWFWEMIDNLGLTNATDSKFDLQRVSKAIDIFLHREYAPDGTGGLIRIPNCEKDLRTMEIWYQVNWYLSEFC